MPQIFDMLGWCEAAPGTGAVPVAAGLDDFIRHNADLDGIITLPRHQWLLGVFAAACATLERTMMRQTGLNNDHEFLRNCLPGDVDGGQGYTHRFGIPLPIVPGENLWCYVDNATSEDTIVGAMIGPGALRTAQIEAVSATEQLIGIGDDNAVIYRWTNIPITWNQTPKKGRYAILGMIAGSYNDKSVHGIDALGLARLKVPGMLDWRPGVPMVIMEADHEEYQSITPEHWNLWGQLQVPSRMNPVYSFTDDQMPDIEVLCIEPLTDYNVELIIRRIGDR